MRERQALDEAMASYAQLERELSDNVELIALGEQESDEEVVAEAEKALKAIHRDAQKREVAALLSGEADPITPPRYAELAAVDLDKAWLLTGTNQGHGLGAVGCMPRVIGGFVDAMALEDGAADCLGDAFAMPFFLDFTGPTP